MKSIHVKTDSKNYEINFFNSFSALSSLLTDVLNQSSTNYLFTDDNVYRLYEPDINRLQSELDLRLYILKNGERSKSMNVVTRVIDFLLKSWCDRKSTLIGYGGGVVGDRELFRYIHNNFSELSSHSKLHNVNMVHRAINVKKKIVELDEREKNLRMILNFGHTVGHGIEYNLKDTITHGEAIILGMYVSILVSLWKGFMCNSTFESIESILKKMIERIDVSILDIPGIMRYLESDKKWFGKKRNFIVLKDISQPEIISNVEPEILESALNNVNLFLKKGNK